MCFADVVDMFGGNLLPLLQILRRLPVYLQMLASSNASEASEATGGHKNAFSVLFVQSSEAA